MVVRPMKKSEEMKADFEAALKDTLEEISKEHLMSREELHKIADIFANTYGSSIEQTRKIAETMVAFKVDVVKMSCWYG